MRFINLYYWKKCYLLQNPVIDFKGHSISLYTFKISQNGHHHFNNKKKPCSPVHFLCTRELLDLLEGQRITSLQETGST